MEKKYDVKFESKKNIRNSTEMYPLMVAYEEGTFTRRTFCQAHHMAFSTLSHWLNKYRKLQEASGEVPSKGRSEFAELIPKEAAIGTNWRVKCIKYKAIEIYAEDAVISILSGSRVLLLGHCSSLGKVQPEKHRNRI